jgi:cell division transport system permease protein
VKLHQALDYFVREACISMARSWKVSLLAVLTIAVSLFIGGAFLLLGANLLELAERWRDESRVVVYLEPGLGAAERQALGERIGARPWVTGIDETSSEQAAASFREMFPALADLIADVDPGAAGAMEPLPASIEIAFRPEAAGSAAFETWVVGLRGEPGVAMVDDDRDWLRQLETAVALVRGGGLVLGGVLLAAAIFTIASVIRLTAYLYHEEIAVMRLVGATEFFIRGPFYTEGLFQGLLGGLAAVTALWAAFAGLERRVAGTLLAAVIAPDFLGWRPLVLLVVLGALAGLTGAVVSLRREALGAEEN